MNKTVVLVVEDDLPIMNLIVTTLKAHDYKYLTANNGQNAIMQASSYNPDIILLDLGLPDIDGIEVIKQIRTWSNVPIIVISARSEDADKIEALDRGADDYLTKPFAMEELSARLRALYRRKREYRVRTLTFGNIELDTEQSELKAHNTISLAFKEVRLLSCLISHAGEAVTIQDLLDDVWPGENADFDMVWMYISFLKGKLESVQANVTIDGDRESSIRLRVI